MRSEVVLRVDERTRRTGEHDVARAVAGPREQRPHQQMDAARRVRVRFVEAAVVAAVVAPHLRDHVRAARCLR